MSPRAFACTTTSRTTRPRCSRLCVASVRTPRGNLIALFEPRSSTASRRIHQEAYAQAFGPADGTLLAPVGRLEIPADERLDTTALAAAIRGGSKLAEAHDSIESLIQRAADLAKPGDTIVAMSNGAFANIHDRLLCAIAASDQRPRSRLTKIRFSTAPNPHSQTQPAL